MKGSSEISEMRTEERSLISQNSCCDFTAGQTRRCCTAFSINGWEKRHRDQRNTTPSFTPSSEHREVMQTGMEIFLSMNQIFSDEKANESLFRCFSGALCFTLLACFVQ